MHPREHFFTLLLASTASLAAAAAPMRGVLYAPYVPGVDPITGEELYLDTYADVFRRDAWVLSQLGATTIMLSPWEGSSHHQALYNATSFWPRQEPVGTPSSSCGKTTCPKSDGPRMLPYLQQSPWDVEIEKLRLQGERIQVVPSFELTPEMLAGTRTAPASAGPAEAALGIAARAISELACAALSPAPSMTTPQALTPFGGGAPPTKINATRAINLLALPNEPSRWQTDAWVFGQNAAIHAIEFLASAAKSVDASNGCATLPAGTPTVPVLVTIQDTICTTYDPICMGAANFVERYNSSLLGSAEVGGFIIATSRTRGCDASALVKDVAASAKSGFGDTVPLELWFSVGMDAFNDVTSAAYPASVAALNATTIAVESRHPNETQQALVTDLRTECLSALVESVESAAKEYCTESISCGVVVEEYADSFWRAAVAPKSGASEDAGQDCATTEAAQEDYADWRLVQGPLGTSEAYPPGFHPPETYQYLSERLFCGALTPNTQVNRTDLDRGLAGLAMAGRLPGSLLCDPQHTAVVYAPSDPFELPACGVLRDQSLDSRHNPAWDGLMEPVPNYDRGRFCNKRASDGTLALRPRRAFYALQAKWRPESDHVRASGMRDWKAFNGDFSLQMEEKNALFLKWPDWTLIFLYLIIAIVLSSILIACFGSSGIKGRLTALVLVVVVYSLNWVPNLPLPCIITFDLGAELLTILLFFVVWAPLNGGGGSGKWWWVHFSVGLMVLQMDDGIVQPWELSKGSCRRTYPVFTMLSVLVESITMKAHFVNPMSAMPSDVCRSGLCCVFNESYVSSLPWSASHPVPQLWDPFLKWSEVLTILLATGVIVIAIAILWFVGVQLVWLAVGQRRPYATRQWAAASPGGDVGASIPLEYVLRALHEGRTQLQAKFGGHFSDDMYETTEQLLKGMLTSRARRGAGYDEQLGVESSYTPRYSLAPKSRRPKHSSMDGGRRSTSPSSSPQAQRRRQSEQASSSSFPTSRIAPTDSDVTNDDDEELLGVRIEAQQMAELWKELTSSLRPWFSEIRLRKVARDEKLIFGSVQTLLRTHASELEEKLATTGWSAHPSVGSPSNNTYLWAMVQLYLLVGSDNFYRAAPDAINMLFTVHACAYVFEDIAERSSGVMLPADSAHSFLTSPGGHLRMSDLANFRAALFLLHRYAGSQLGNRIDTLFKEKAMNYDDLAELCTRNGGDGLFEGLEKLCQVMYNQADVCLDWTVDLSNLLLDGNNILFRARAHLEKARKLLRESERLDPRTMSDGYNRLAQEQAELRAELVEMNRQNSSSNRSTFSGQISVALRETTNSFAEHDPTVVVRSAMSLVLLVLTIEGLRELVKPLASLPTDEAADAVLDAVRALPTGPAVEDLLQKTRDLQTRLKSPQPTQSGTPLREAPLLELSAILNDVRAALTGVKLGAVANLTSNSVRFTWGRDGHKTALDYRTGYSSLLIDMWFFWRAMILLVLMLAFYASGGFVSWCIARALDWASTPFWCDKVVQSGVPSKYFGNACETLTDSGMGIWNTSASQMRTLKGVTRAIEDGITGDGYAGEWLLYAMILLVVSHAMDVVLALIRFLYAFKTDTLREHLHWRRCRELRRAYSENRLFTAICSMCITGRHHVSPEMSTAQNPRRKLDANGQLIMPSMGAIPSAKAIVEFDFDDEEGQRSTLLSRRPFFLRLSALCKKLVSEMMRRFIRPVKSALAFIGLLPLWMGMAVHGTTRTAVDERAILPSLMSLIFRVAVLLVHMLVWAERRILITLVFAQMWWSIGRSLFETLISRHRPSDLFCCFEAHVWFGWWYAWCSPPWSQRLQPRERRSAKETTLNAVFIVTVLFFWMQMSMQEVQELVAVMYAISKRGGQLLYFPDSHYRTFVNVTLASVVALCRVGYTVLYALAVMQLFFATVLAAAGAFTSASTSIFGWMGSVWDRTQALGRIQIEEAAHGFWRRRPSSIILSSTSQLTMREQEIALFVQLWNRGMVQDMIDAHQLDTETAERLMIGGVDLLADDLRNRGPREMPDLTKLASSLCYDARRRVHDFLYCARRTKGVPVAPLVAHMPSLTILMPAYGERVLSSWVQITHREADWKLSDLRYMAEKRNDELNFLIGSLSGAERAAISQHVVFTVGEEGGTKTVLTDFDNLRDALWFSEHLLAISKAGILAAGDNNSHSAQALRLANLLLDWAIEPPEQHTQRGGRRVLVGSEKPGPAAPDGCNADVLLELDARRKLMDEAAALGMPCLDDLVVQLFEPYDSPVERSYDDVMDMLKVLHPRVATATAAKALEALGVSRAHGWRPSGRPAAARDASDPQYHSRLARARSARGSTAAQMAAAGAPSTGAPVAPPVGLEGEGADAATDDESSVGPTRLCLELHRTRAEADVKVKLRKWFANREQSVWRTLAGLSKIQGALEQMHKIECELSANGDTAGPLPENLVTIIASFQIYSTWRIDQRKKVGECEKIAASLRAAEMPGLERLSKMDKLRASILDVMVLSDQINGVHQALQDFSGPGKTLHTSYLEDRPGGFACTTLRAKGQLMLDAEGKLELNEHQRRDPDRYEIVLDARGSPFVHRTVQNLRLPGNPVKVGIAEGKPTNQAHAMLHAQSELLMVVDMNQGVDLEQAFFLPAMLTKFHTDDSGRPVLGKNVRVVGFRENVFTDADGIVANSGALNEYVFGTIVQRQMYMTLNVRLHYGHPDCFDYVFALVHGGTSKSSKTYNMSEDVFGGINVFLHGGGNVYVDFLQIDKGRDVQYDAALSFEQKIASGTAMQSLTRDFKRLMGSPLCFFQKLSGFLGSVGIFFSNTMLAYAVLTLVAMNTAAAFTPHDFQMLLYDDTEVSIPLINLGFVYIFAVIVQKMGEQGIVGGLRACIVVLATVPLNLAKIKIHQYAVHRAVSGGVSLYVGTGRELATTRSTFDNAFERYALSHLNPALDMAVLLALFIGYSELSLHDRLGLTLAPIIVCLSWTLAPALYNPYGFSMSSLLADWRKWRRWLNTPSFDDWRLGQQKGKRTGDFKNTNWFFWLNCEPASLQLLYAIIRLALWGGIFASILMKITDPPPGDLLGLSAGQLLTHHRISDFEHRLAVFLPVMIVLVLAVRLKGYLLQVGIGLLVVVFFVASIFAGHLGDFLALIYPLFRALSCIFELMMIIVSSRPWRAFDADEQRDDVVSSANMLILPRNSPMLNSLIVISVAKLHATLVAMFYFGLSFIVAALGLIPIFFVVVLTIAWSLHGMLDLLAYQTDPAALIPGASAAFGETIFYLALLVLPLITVMFIVRGRLQRKRIFPVSHVRFYLFSLNLNTLHHWFIFNRATAVDLAESAARDESADGAPDRELRSSLDSALLPTPPRRRGAHTHVE